VTLMEEKLSARVAAVEAAQAGKVAGQDEIQVRKTPQVDL
jgi:hypothetical protein